MCVCVIFKGEDPNDTFPEFEDFIQEDETFFSFFPFL